MTFNLLEDRKEISRAQSELKKIVRREFRGDEHRTIGFPGGNIRNATVWTSGPYWYYNSIGGKKSRRYWNWFGRLKDEGHLHIAFEANVPIAGRNGRVSGFLARDDSSGLVYLMHSGGVGGGTKGVGKTSFLAWLNEPPIEVRDSTGGTRWGIIVMPVKGQSATAPAIRYVEKVIKYKEAARDGQLETPAVRSRIQMLQNFQAEGRGRRTRRCQAQIDYVSRHGEVVDALHDWRDARGLPTRTRLVKNVLLDLGVARSKDVIEAYEVKTATSRQNIYAAIGQVLVHGPGSCSRFIVLPDNGELPRDIVNALEEWDIAIIRYSIGRKGVRIHDA